YNHIFFHLQPLFPSVNLTSSPSPIPHGLTSDPHDQHSTPLTAQQSSLFTQPLTQAFTLEHLIHNPILFITFDL
ncbi:hypothetical protein VIGAN_11158000, partial [Vigna angularis var. angularis]